MHPSEEKKSGWPPGFEASSVLPTNWSCYQNLFTPLLLITPPPAAPSSLWLGWLVITSPLASSLLANLQFSEIPHVSGSTSPHTSVASTVGEDETLADPVWTSFLFPKGGLTATWPGPTVPHTPPPPFLCIFGTQCRCQLPRSPWRTQNVSTASQKMNTEPNLCKCES